MMLKPFRIRNLYDTSPGVVQLTAVQYDSTIKSQPEAALSYLDDDDGETILVGSSLELEQRLDEPVPSRLARAGPSPSVSEDSDNSMHTFDVKKSPASLATWREHEAYTSKALRKSPLKSTTSRNPPASSAPSNLDSMPPASAPESQPDLPLSLEDAIKGALQGLETHVGVFAGFLQDTSSTLRAAAQNTREADVSAIGGILDGFKGIFSEVGKVGRAMVEAFNAEALAMSPMPSQPIVEDSTIKLSAARTKAYKDSSNTYVVPADVGADNVVASSSGPAQVAQPSIPATRTATSSKDPSYQHNAAKRLGTLFENREEPLPSSFARARTSEPAPSSEKQPEKMANAPFAVYASLKDPWKIGAEKRPDEGIGCNYCELKQVDCKKTFSNSACKMCIADRQSCSLVTQPASTLPLPEAWYDETYKSTGTKPNDLAAHGHYPPQQLNPQQSDRIQLPRETAKSYAQPKAAISRSILDLENSDQDFSTRYPPLMSLRKSKTIPSLADRSRSPFLASINPEAAISRFPSLSQIEQEARSHRRTDAPHEDVDVSRRRWNSVKDSEKRQPVPALPKLVIPGRPVADAAPATPPKLPGAWPEVDGPALTISEESSNAFADRVVRSGSPEPARRSFRYIPAHARHSHALGTQYLPRHLREPPNVDTSNMPRHLRHAASVDTMATQLGRSQTITASNPAARLTRPFDPLEDGRQSRDTNALPRRSGTERYRRRPYNDSFTGEGRVPWDSFENVSQMSRPRAARHEPRSSRRDSQPSNNVDQSSTGFGFGISDKVGECVRQLRDMGYGNRSPNEASRLSIYAAACNGEVVDAVEMIEEDRKAGRLHKNVGDRLGVRPFNHNERPIFGR